MGNPSKDGPWEAIFSRYGIHGHDFDKAPFPLSAQQIKDATKDFPKTGQREVRILCYQAERKDRPQVFSDNGLFLLPVKNGHYVIVRGEGYIDISDITSPPVEFTPKAEFELQTPLVGDSEMQHLDFAHASGMLEDFVYSGTDQNIQTDRYADGIVIRDEDPIVRVAVIGSACTPPGYVTLEGEPIDGWRITADQC